MAVRYPVRLLYYFAKKTPGLNPGKTEASIHVGRKFGGKDGASFFANAKLRSPAFEVLRACPCDSLTLEPLSCDVSHCWMMRMSARYLPTNPCIVGQALLVGHARPYQSPLRNICQPALQQCRHRFLSVDVQSRPAVSLQTFEYSATAANAGETSAVSVLTAKTRPPSFEPGHGHLNQQPLPASCPGCGALSQELSTDEPGYYTRSRKAVKGYLRSLRDARTTQETSIEWTEPSRPARLDDGCASIRGHAPNEGIKLPMLPSPVQEVPICDRCHDLIYNSRGTSIAHPTIEAIADSIAESPFRRNHVYHVMDAVDFPLSLIPSIFRTLSLASPRSQNRRSQHDFSKKPTLSFVITRSDLLAPTKEMVDSLMPYVTTVLRQALGRFARDIRLGNVHLVSAKRGWWTTDIKDSIWERGGGNWMVGKVNVGKSNLFEVLFPKGSGERAPSYTELEQETNADQSLESWSSSYVKSNNLLSETSLLPPPQPEVAFPILPLVSSLPGTTASPIRLPFGKHKGELIDLPGLARGNLEDFVQPEHRLSLVMTHRPTVTQHVIKPGQSLLLGGGLVRITPLLDESDPSTTMLAYPFVPVPAHVTSTEKAIGAQSQTRQSYIKTILAKGAGETMRLAGKFKLDTDVTRARARGLIDAGVPLQNLPFRIYSSDVLVEGVGWVELVCQVRRQRKPFPSPLPGMTSLRVDSVHGDVIDDIHPERPSNATQSHDGLSEFDLNSEHQPTTVDGTIPGALEDFAFQFPQVEIHTPNGAHVGKRRPMGAWLLLEAGRKRKAMKSAAGARPRKSMKGAKKQEKAQRRAREAAEGGGPGSD